MSAPSLNDLKKGTPIVSPYLMRPLRSYQQVLDEMAAAKQRAMVVTPFIRVASTERTAARKIAGRGMISAA